MRRTLRKANHSFSWGVINEPDDIYELISEAGKFLDEFDVVGWLGTDDFSDPEEALGELEMEIDNVRQALFALGENLYPRWTGGDRRGPTGYSFLTADEIESEFMEIVGYLDVGYWSMSAPHVQVVEEVLPEIQRLASFEDDERDKSVMDMRSRRYRRRRVVKVSGVQSELETIIRRELDEVQNFDVEGWLRKRPYGDEIDEEEVEEYEIFAEDIYMGIHEMWNELGDWPDYVTADELHDRVIEHVEGKVNEFSMEFPPVYSLDRVLDGLEALKQFELEMDD